MKEYQECGCCGHLHAPDYWGDCRDDSARFSLDDLDAMHGPGGYDWQDLDDSPAWQAGCDLESL